MSLARVLFSPLTVSDVSDDKTLSSYVMSSECDKHVDIQLLESIKLTRLLGNIKCKAIH